MAIELDKGSVLHVLMITWHISTLILTVVAALLTEFTILMKPDEMLHI